MQNNKTLSFIIFGVGIALSAITLLFLPVPIFGLYLLLGIYKPEISNLMRILIAIFGSLAIVMVIATIISFMLY